MHTLALRIYYEDTDLAGVVYYANYLKFIERGRTEALRTLGVDQAALKAAGRVFVVRRLVADYLRPARFDDLLEVQTATRRVGAASVEMEQKVLRDTVTLFRAEVQIACVDTGSGRAARLPSDIRASLLQTIAP